MEIENENSKSGGFGFNPFMTIVKNAIGEDGMRLLNKVTSQGLDAELGFISGTDSGLKQSIYDVIGALSDYLGKDEKKYNARKISDMLELVKANIQRVNLGHPSNPPENHIGYWNGTEMVYNKPLYYILSANAKIREVLDKFPSSSPKSGGDSDGIQLSIIVCVLIILFVYLFCNVILRLSHLLSGIISIISLYAIGKFQLASLVQ